MKVLGIVALILFCAGCSSFDVLATRRYVDDSNNYVLIEEGRDEEYHEFMTTLDNGRVIPDKTKSKIRMTLPDGRRFVMYQRLSAIGNMFKTDDEDWEFWVMGMHCKVGQRPKNEKRYAQVFEGTLCATERNPLNERDARNQRRSSTVTKGFKSPNATSSSTSSGKR